MGKRRRDKYHKKRARQQGHATSTPQAPMPLAGQAAQDYKDNRNHYNDNHTRDRSNHPRSPPDCYLGSHIVTNARIEKQQQTPPHHRSSGNGHQHRSYTGEQRPRWQSQRPFPFPRNTPPERSRHPTPSKTANRPHHDHHSRPSICDYCPSPPYRPLYAQKYAQMIRSLIIQGSQLQTNLRALLDGLAWLVKPDPEEMDWETCNTTIFVGGGGGGGGGGSGDKNRGTGRDECMRGEGRLGDVSGAGKDVKMAKCEEVGLSNAPLESGLAHDDGGGGD